MLDGFLKGVFLGKNLTEAVQLSVEMGLGNDVWLTAGGKNSEELFCCTYIHAV